MLWWRKAKKTAAILYLNEQTIEVGRREGKGSGVNSAERWPMESTGFGGGARLILAKEMLLPPPNSAASVFVGVTSCRLVSPHERSVCHVHRLLPDIYTHGLFSYDSSSQPEGAMARIRECS